MNPQANNPKENPMNPYDYFPVGDFGDVYCPHLGAQLGPCEQCDDPAYLAYLEESAAETMLDEPPGFDSRGLDIAPDPDWHIPLVEIPGGRRSGAGRLVFAYTNTSPTATLLALNEQGTPLGTARYSPAEVAVRNCVKRLERIVTSDPDGLDRWLRISTHKIRLRREGLLD